MNTQAFRGQWDHFRQIVGIAIRLADTLPENKLDSHPIPKMRTPRELIVHMFGMALRGVMEGTATGSISNVTETDEKTIAATLKTRADISRYCRENWAAADKAALAITDEKLAGIVKTPWGMDFPGFVAVGVTYDEFIHHRGQLYAYLRALGCDVPMMWDFEHNAAPFLPAATAKV
ncbi:MAG: hypothetical protein HYR73_00740 [Candidatus Eisenbacteria bacterium]|nr:hypothetical protein [Candidatus Eisenbacteria bacterium]